MVATQRRKRKVKPLSIADTAIIGRLGELERKFSREYHAEKSGVAKRCQVYAMNASGRCVWAGPHIIRRLCGRSARKLQRRWREWRYLYDNQPDNRNRDYPAKHGDNRVVRLSIEWNGQFHNVRV